MLEEGGGCRSTPRVLVADDDEAALLVMRSTLVREGYDVICVGSGKAAIASCAGQLPDLVLMDAIMPEMDGFRTTQELRQLFDDKEIPILIITSLNDNGSVESAFNAGATDFIPKPIHWPVLLQRVRRMIDAKRLAETLAVERLRAEEERDLFEYRLRQSHKMEAIGRLAGGIAHDFNNILTAIIGYADLALEMIERNNPEKLRKYLTEIGRAGDRARGLIRQMLDYSRQGCQKQEVVAVERLVDEVVSLLRSILPSSTRIELERPAEPFHVLVDPVRLHQLIMNLCINARDAMDGRGEIRISIAAVHADELLCGSCCKSFSGEYVRLAVSDTGCGIDPAILGKIFDPFFTTKEIGQGTGMGLAVVHGILHNHDGHIVVRSEPGGGSSFELYLPRVETTVAAPGQGGGS